jgi:crotonobetainyl-CoA:carnitine CoA-transferase CaiB-like acyl-CoA transferase
MRRNYLQLEPGRGPEQLFHPRERGKESVSIDLSRSDGQGIVQDLAKVADVVVENFMPESRPGSTVTTRRSES